MKRFVRILLVMTIVVFVVATLAIFIFPPTLDIIRPFICPQDYFLSMEPSPVLSQNIIFTCTNSIGVRIDATGSVFKYSCFGIVITLLLLSVLVLVDRIRKVTRK
jgi:hypothetical protein